MVVKKIPENGTKFLAYEVDGNSLNLNDGDTIINLEKREQDYPVHIDFALNSDGMLVNGTEDGKYYAAQIDIPARQYTDETVDNPDYDESQEESETNQKTITTHTPVDFSMDNIVLTLWEVQ